MKGRMKSGWRRWTTRKPELAVAANAIIGRQAPMIVAFANARGAVTVRSS